MRLGGGIMWLGKPLLQPCGAFFLVRSTCCGCNRWHWRCDLVTETDGDVVIRKCRFWVFYRFYHDYDTFLVC